MRAEQSRVATVLYCIDLLERLGWDGMGWVMYADEHNTNTEMR